MSVSKENAWKVQCLKSDHVIHVIADLIINAEITENLRRKTKRRFEAIMMFFKNIWASSNHGRRQKLLGVPSLTLLKSI